MIRLHSLAILPVLAAGLSFAHITPAHACGGTFCDTGPTAMPVDQTGENILFRISEGSVEAHIQIQIDPETTAEQFAWVIPVAALPEFEVGSQILFDNMLNGSVPSYGLNSQSESCGGGTGDSGFTGGEDSDSDSDGDPTGDGDGDDNGVPEVVFEGQVGAFEVAVLDGGTVEGVMSWLDLNGYQQDPNAEPILAQYLEEEFLFVALKLGVESGVEEVHPIVIRYAGDEPCVPIRLTRIAASEDMEIRTFFLDDARVVPTNYRHVLVNPLKLNWLANANNYKEVITMAVDADEANGNAFVTEYAGTNSVISLAGVYDNIWNTAPFEALLDSPVGAITELIDQGLLYCDPGECIALHPLLDPILAEFIPVPDQVSQGEYYSCLECYPDLIDVAAWDAAAFALRLDDRIFAPGLRARQLIQETSYLTRMYTTISPGEMNADPVFAVNTTLPNVGRTRIAQRFNACNGSTTVTLPDGRVVYFPPNAPVTWPDFQAEMPWDEDVDQSGNADDAPLISLVDNTEMINDLLEEYNNSNNGGSGGGEGGDPGADGDLASNGCGCMAESSGPAGGGLALGLGLLGLLGLRRRRSV